MDGLSSAFGAAELRGIHQHLGSPPTLLMLEILTPDPDPDVFMHELRPRAWAQRGFARCAEFSEPIPLAEAARIVEAVAEWAECLRHADATGGVTLVFAPGMVEQVQELRVGLELLLLESERVRFAALQYRNNRLYVNTRATLPAEPAPDLSGQFEVVLEARNRLAWNGPRWPLLASLCGLAANRRHALVRILAHSPDSAAAPLPGEAWFQIEGPAADKNGMSIRIRIGIELALRAQDDRWDLRSESPGTGEIYRVAPPPVVDDSGPAIHLAVIFDRTCPDASAWPQARWPLVNPSSGPAPVSNKKGLASLLEEPEKPAPAASPEPKKFRLEDCNLALRNGIGRALRETLPRLGPLSQVVVYPFWFADSATAEFEPLDGDEINRRVAGSLAPFRASEPALEKLFNAQPYVSSYDVFDPLEQALHDAVETLERQLASAIQRTPAQAAIVIIGNSPPVFSALGDSREQAALQRFWQVAGMRFGSRPRPGTNRRWSEELRAAGRGGIPVVYVFLTLDADAPGPDDGQLGLRPDRMKQVEECVRISLADFDELYLPHAVTATPEGVRAGLTSAFEHLAAGLGTGHSALTLSK